MLQLIPIALFALSGFSAVANAAPTPNALMSASPMAEAPVGIVSAPAAANWKRHHQQAAESHIFTEAFIKSAVAEAMAKQNSVLVKREDAAPGIDLGGIFRGVFDKIVDHIIEVTPLNDIVHGNYDFLYDIFLAKIGEAVSGAGAPAEETPTVDALDAPAANSTTVADITAATKDTKDTKPAKDTSAEDAEEDNDDEDDEEEDDEEDNDDDEEDDDEDDEEDNEDDDDEEDDEDWEDDDEKSWNEDDDEE
ncbi:hypothetical protein INT47_012967 [Mucor saturninus]|uniref:Uncharacterized protein n=1 Tax=Mucor saturninus TaxID=64648 RepID=A0A8H7QX42_9FUNG|nr:hypothetical protein INT47_012967 [Mucor saturninus]